MDASQTWPTSAPSGLRTEAFVLRPITPSDAAADFDAVIDSRADLIGWEQTGWPADDFTVEDNPADLVGLAAENEAGRRYTYTVVEPGGDRALGCVYVAPPTVKFLARAEIVALGTAGWDGVQAAVHFWMRTSLSEFDLETRLVAELDRWLHDDWGLTAVVFVTTRDFDRQIGVLKGLGMSPAFEIRQPGKSVPYLAFA